jgi:hypothetical protein
MAVSVMGGAGDLGLGAGTQGDMTGWHQEMLMLTRSMSNSLKELGRNSTKSSIFGGGSSSGGLLADLGTTVAGLLASPVVLGAIAGVIAGIYVKKPEEDFLNALDGWLAKLPKGDINGQPVTPGDPNNKTPAIQVPGAKIDPNDPRSAGELIKNIDYAAGSYQPANMLIQYTKDIKNEQNEINDIMKDGNITQEEHNRLIELEKQKSQEIMDIETLFLQGKKDGVDLTTEYNDAMGAVNATHQEEIDLINIGTGYLQSRIDKEKVLNSTLQERVDIQRQLNASYNSYGGGGSFSGTGLTFNGQSISGTAGNTYQTANSGVQTITTGGHTYGIGIRV